MDLWVVAAAAGAGYVAKNLQTLTSDKKESLWEPALKYPVNAQSESRNLLQQIRHNTCPLRRLEQNRGQDDEFNVKFSAIEKLRKRDSAVDVTSTSTSVSGRETSEFDDGESKNNSRLHRPKFVRSRRSSLNCARPLISLEVDSEQSKEGEMMEQNLFSRISSVSTVRPMLVTDGAGIISGSSSASSLVQFEGGGEEGRRENSVGSSLRNTMLRSGSLDRIDSAELQKKPRRSSGLARMNGPANRVSDRTYGSQGPGGMPHFILGVTIGIFYATTASKREVENLNKQLKQTQTLVQDLHEELDMREMITVKELANEGNHKLLGENDTLFSTREPISSPSDEDFKKSIVDDSPKPSNKNNENHELMSKIEEELQAELEMLEHSMTASAHETIPNVVELDPDFVQRDLKPMMAQETRDDESDSGNKSTGTTTNFSQPNYAVSPWELSLRLHELIESRLEERIKELEIALSNSQNRGQVLGSQSIVSGTRLSYSETEYSGSPHSPIYVCGHNTTDWSLAKNFSRNSLDLNRETGEIFARATENDKEREGERSSDSDMDYEVHSSVKKLIDELFSETQNSVSPHTAAVKERDGASEDLVQDKIHTWGRQTTRSLMLDEDFESDDDEGTDESEMLLIKRIVERRRSGSNFFFNFDG